jgi:hypothetical protein
MTKPTVALLSCVLLGQSSPAAAEEVATAIRQSVLSPAVGSSVLEGPLRRASLSIATPAMLRDPRWIERPARADRPSRQGSWMERHPVLAGALVGFGTGFLLTYAVAHHDDDELLQVISPGAAATFWGGVGAGIGALAGWGVGRNRDDGPSPDDQRTLGTR